MSIPRAGTRPYRSPRRRDQAAATRASILDAARDLFVARGYARTSIEAIAGAAGVAAETVYAAFGTKRALLATLVDVAIVGDDDPVPIAERAWVQRLADEPDPGRRVAVLAHQGRLILERRAPIDEVLRGAAAADADLEPLLAAGRAERWAGQRALLRLVLGSEGPRTGLAPETAADIVFAIGSPEVYGLLVGERGWSPEEFEAWYAEALRRLVVE